MSHPFDRYFAKHGHYPHVVVNSGVQRLTVEFAPGYVRVKTSPPYGGEIYITAAAIRASLKAGVFSRLLSLHMRQDRSFDVPAAVHKAHLAELKHLQALRAQKKNRTFDHEKAERQRRRHLRARARAAQRLDDAS